MHWIMLSCKRSAQLMEKKLQFGLSPVEKLQLSMHKKACKYCTAFEKQNEFIEEILNQSIGSSEVPQQHLSDPEKVGLKTDIEQKIK